MPIPLIRNGTVIRGDPVRRLEHIVSKPDDVTPNREVAPIEEVTHVVEGLTFTITIIFKALEGEETGLSCPPDTGYPILCADDNLIHQRLLFKALSRYGQDAIMAANGLQAVELYKANPGRYHCIFMDIDMPIMNGVEATRQIRAFEASHPKLRHSVIVGLPVSSVAIHAEILSAGFDCLICKPFNMSIIYEMFLSGPDTNFIFQYGCLTEQEKAAYPRRDNGNFWPGDDPRSNAISQELIRRRDEYDWPVFDSSGTKAIHFTKIIVRVIERSEDEPDVKKKETAN